MDHKNRLAGDPGTQHRPQTCLLLKFSRVQRSRLSVHAGSTTASDSKSSSLLRTFSLYGWDDAAELLGTQQDYGGGNPLPLTLPLLLPSGWQKRQAYNLTILGLQCIPQIGHTSLALVTQSYTRTDRSNCTWELPEHTRHPDGCLDWQGPAMHLQNPAILIFCKECFAFVDCY